MKLHLRCLTGFSICLCFAIFIIFVIKWTPIWEIIIQSSKTYTRSLRRIKIKAIAKSIALKDSILDLVEFLDLSLLNYIDTTTY